MNIALWVLLVLLAMQTRQVLLTPGSSFRLALATWLFSTWPTSNRSFTPCPGLLKPGGSFVFSLTHPAFNNTSSVHVAEEMDVEGQIKTVYSLKVSRYMTPSSSPRRRPAWPAQATALL